jgi:CheY-like chemotaxis protein
MPKDIVSVFRDRYNKDIVFTIQRENKIVDSLTIRRNYSRNTADNKKSVENNQIDLEAEKQKSRQTLHDVNILLVDDESDALKVYQWILNSEGYYNIQTFTESLKAIKHMADLKSLEHYSLAIIDIRMPIINGIQLYNILKIFNPKLKVLFVSALDAVEELASIYHIAHEDIIRKPFGRQDFITTVNNAVSKIPEK